MWERQVIFEEEKKIIDVVVQMKRIFICAIYRVVTYMIYLGCDNNQDISTSHHLSFVIYVGFLSIT